jgi:hypothetical protein
VASDAYKVKQDVSIPRAVRQVDELPDGTKTYETEGRTYAVGDYVLSEDISPPILERVEAGELDDFLEAASLEDAEAAMRAQAGYGTFAAEHSMEAYILDQYGHTVVPREQMVELAAAGNEASAEAAEEAKADGADERDLPGLPEDEVDEENLPDERPPGIAVGEALAESKGGGSDKPKTRARPQASEAPRRGRPPKAEEAKPAS